MKRDDEEIHKHPSYGLIGFSRRQGNPGRLFGSPLADHGSYICLKIARAELIRDDRQDTFFGSMRGDVVEVDLSAAQFAELLTTMNVGMGVPCTIRLFDGKKVEDPPNIPHETEKFRASFRKKISSLVSGCEFALKDIKGILEKKSLSQEDRRTVISKFESVLMEVRSNAPHMVDLFHEVTEKVVTHAKAEVDAFVTANVVAAGIKSILSASTEKQVQALPPAADECNSRDGQETEAKVPDL